MTVKPEASFGTCIICAEEIKAGDGMFFFETWVGRETGLVDPVGRVVVHQGCFYDALRHYRKEKEDG